MTAFYMSAGSVRHAVTCDSRLQNVKVLARWSTPIGPRTVAVMFAGVHIRLSGNGVERRNGAARVRLRNFGPIAAGWRSSIGRAVR